MLATEYLRFKRDINEKGIIFSFAGFLSEGVLFALGDALKQKMTIEETDANTAKKVFSVFVEQVQNIIRYSAERVSSEAETRRMELSSGVISVGRENERFFVVCANTIANDDAVKLKERLEKLRTLDKDALKAHYREKLKDPAEADSKGATIGLIEIARRSSAPIEFDFMELDQQNSFFCLKAFI